ncbi:MAG: hypothetical protein R6V55_04980 [Desulfovermiculus sp.]
MLEADANFQAWLQSKPGLDFLSLCARRAFGQLPEGMYGPKNSPDALQDVLHDLWLFIAELGPDKRQDLVLLAEQGEGSKLISIVIKLFVRSCLDKRRTWAQSPWHALYRRLRTLLSQAPDIAYLSEASQAWYAWTKQSDLKKEPLLDQDFTNWAPPPFASQDLMSSDNLIHAARFFWDQARKTTGRIDLISVRSLTNYLGAHFPEHVRIPIVYAQDRTRSDTSEEHPKNEPQDVSSGYAPEHMITAQMLPQLAADFAAGLSSLERDLWLLRFEQELGLKDMAHRLGLRNASGVHYHYAKIEKRFQDLCILWPGLSPEDQNRDLAISFLEATIAACKQKTQSREE